jgi:tetratricopeptide (TPR) repeat protein
MNLFFERNLIKNKVACLLILILLSVIVYFNSLKGAFQFDDRNLLSKEWIEDLNSFNKGVSFKSIPERPILLWTLAANNHLDNKNTFGFHLANLNIHILVSILIFTILIRIKNLIPKDDSDKEENIYLNNKQTNVFMFPFVTSLIFALHPLNTDSVSYISSRSSLLATFFFLLTIYCFSETFLSYRTRKYQTFIGLLIIPGIYLAVASKLIAITLPLVILFLFLLLYVPRWLPDYAEYFTVSKILWFFICLGIILIILELLFEVLYLPRDQGYELYGKIPYLLVQFKVIIFFYLVKFVFPLNLNVDSGFPFTGLTTDWLILFSFILIASITFMVVKCKNTWLKLGYVWFFLLIAPTSSIIPLNDLAVEHRMYLPMSLGLCLITGWFISRTKNKIQLISFIIVVIIFGILVANRNQAWTSEIALWSDSVIKNPNSPRVHNNLGKAYYEAGKLKIARSHLEKSVSSIPDYIKNQFNIKNPKNYLERKSISDKTFKENNISKTNHISLRLDFAEPHYNLANIYLDLEQLERAELEYRAALKLKPNYYSAELGLGSVKNKKKEYNLAIDHFLNSITLMKKTTGKSDYPLARLNLGEVYGKIKNYDKAILELNLALKTDPSMYLAHYNLGTAYMLKGFYDSAENSFKACLKIRPNHEPALFNLGRVYQKKKQWITSNEVFNQFLKIKGPNPNIYSEIAWNNLMEENIDKAISLYEKVLSYKQNHKAALINLAKINFRLRKYKISRFYIERALKQSLPQSQLDNLNKLLKKIPTE